MKDIVKEIDVDTGKNIYIYIDTIITMASLLADDDNNNNNNTTTTVAPATKQGVGFVNGVETEILYIAYTNRDFILITQMGKLGTTFNIKKYTDSNGEAKQVVDTVFGKRGDTTLELYARMVARLVSPKSIKPIIVSLALNNPSLDHREDMNKMIEQIL